jgi:EmrB/QacA subfamily drug resistance transporter
VIDDSKPGITLGVLALAQFITSVDFNIVYVALPEIGDRLGFSAQSLQWVFSAYSVVFGGFLLLGGRAADLFGRRRMFILGLALYAGASLLGGLASAPPALVVSRAVQGLGGAVLFPATVSPVNTLFEEGKPRNRALALWSLAGSGGLTLGSLLGGVLVGALGWTSVFFVNVPITLLAGVGAVLVIPRDARLAKPRGLDLPGAVTVTAGVTLLVFALAHAPEWGWTSMPVLAGAIAAVVLLAGFVVLEARSASPIMPLRMLAQGDLAAAMGLAFLFMATFMALPYFLTELFQRINRYTPLETGFAFLVPCLAIAAGTQIGGRIVTMLGVRRVLLLGLSAGAAGTAVLAFVIAPGVDYAHLVPGLVVLGIGQGMTWVAMWIAAGTGMALQEQGVAAGMTSTSLWIGGGTGLAILVAIASAAAGGAAHASTDARLTDGIRIAVYAIAAGIAAMVPLALFTGRAVSAKAPVIS